MRKTAGTAEIPARQQTLNCDIQILMVITCWQIYMYAIQIYCH